MTRRILAYDTSFDDVGEKRMRASASALRAGTYRREAGLGRGNICLRSRLHAETETSDPDKDVPDGDLVASWIMLTRELTDAVDAQGLDPMIVAAEVLEGRRIGCEDEKPVAIIRAIASSLTPGEHERNVYLRMRTPWTPLAVTIERGPDTIIETEHPEVGGPLIVDLGYHEEDMIVISTHTAVVDRRMDLIDAMRTIARYEEDRDQGDRDPSGGMT